MDTGLGSHSFARVPRSHRYLINPDEQTSVPISIILDSRPSHFFSKNCWAFYPLLPFIV